MSTNALALVAIEAQTAAENTEGDFDAKAVAAFKAAQHHWMVTDEDAQFKGAVVGLYEIASERQKAGIKHELEVLKNLSALLSGVPVNMDRLVPEHDEEPVTIGLRRLWDEAKNGVS